MLGHYAKELARVRSSHGPPLLDGATMLFSYFKHIWNEWKAEKERARKEAEEAACRTIWRIYHESKTMDDVSRMSGTQFEEFLARLFSHMGYTEISLTPPNDQGGDLLCL